MIQITLQPPLPQSKNQTYFNLNLSKKQKINQWDTYQIFQSWILSNQIRRLTAPGIKGITGNVRVTRDKKKLKRQKIMAINWQLTAHW